MMFALNQTEIANGYNNAAANPYNPERDSAPGFFDEALTRLPTGFEQGGAEIGLALTGGSEHAQDVIKSLKPDPMTTGWLGNILQGVGSVVPSAIIGTLATGGNPVGGALAVGETKGYAAMKELQAKGVDEATAAKAGAVEGITQGLGVMAPASVGGKVATRIATGAGINVGIGAVQRGATGKILEASGYKEMADQYRILDGMQIFTDATIGGLFGGLHTEGGRVPKRDPLPSEIDAALAANNIHQLEIESAPGIPADLETRNAHVAAMDTATEQVLRGDSVDVANKLPETNFLPKPDNAEVRTAVDEALQENSLNITIENNKVVSSEVGKPVEDVYVKTPKEPLGLTDWVKQSGGIRDEGGDVRSVLGGAKYRPGLINKKGLSADELALRAWEQGYFPESSERPNARDFLNKLTEDIAGNKQYSHNDAEAATTYHNAVAHNNETDKLAAQYGIETKNKSRADFWSELSGKMSEEQRDREILDRQAASDAEYAQWQEKTQAWLESRGDAWEPERIISRTLKDLENEYQQEKLAGVLPESNGSGEVGAAEGRSGRNSGGLQESSNARGNSDESSGSEKIAKQIVSEKPNLKITDESGNVTTASEALAKADEEIAQAKKDASLFEAAVNCFIRSGQ